MHEFAVVAVLHRRQHLPRRIGGESRLGNARKVLAELVAVFLGRRAERVAIDLDEESAIGLRTLGAAWIVGIEKAFRIALPLEITAGRPPLDARHHLEGLLA